MPKRQYKRVKTPTLIQMETVECGAACLGIILGYYGCYIPLEELRTSCGVTRDGASALGILRGSKIYGLEGHGYRRELDQLFDEALPFIAHWGFNHFVVIEGFGRNKVYINDPAYGPRKISYGELDACFTGVVLTFTKTPEFKKTPAPPLFSSVFFQRIAVMKWGIICLILIGILLVALQLSLAGFSQIFIDYLLEGKLLTWKWYFLIVMGVVCGLIFLLNAIKQEVLNRFYVKLSLMFSTQFFWHAISLPISFFAQRFSGEIASRMTLNEGVALALVKVVTDGILSLLVASIFGFALFYYDTLIACVALAIVLLNVFLIYVLYRVRQDAYACYQQEISKSNAYAIGGLRSIETIKATSSESKFFSRWAGYYAKVLNTVQVMTRWDAIGGVAPIVLGNIVNLTVIMIGIWRIMNGHLTIGMLVAIQILLQNFTAPVFYLMGLMQTIQLLKVDSARLEDVLKNPIDPYLANSKDSPPTQTSGAGKLEGYLHLKNVSFGFTPNVTPILHDINLNLSPGKSVALIGPTGCGKSTIAKLIGGLYHPLGGEILIDGTPCHEIPRTMITNSLAVVEQENSLFSATVTDNITLMEAFPVQSDLIRAAQDACIHEEILKRKGGYELLLEANGGNLSGGQQQRIQIARALYRNPVILILDEATSALDSATEAEVIKNIRRRGCACLMVAHRLSTIMNCDEILVISKGTIIQRGTHLELIKQKGLYKVLVDLEKLNEAEA